MLANARRFQKDACVAKIYTLFIYQSTDWFRVVSFREELSID